MLFGDLRLKIARQILRKKAVQLKRQKCLHDFSSARLIGLLCASPDEVSTRVIKDFLQFLTRKNISYKVLGYFPLKKIPNNFLYWNEMDFFTQQDINFWGIPKSDMADRFLAQSFDMLIDCSMDNSFQSEYIVRLSKAKCKVGAGLHDANDLSIEMGKKHDLAFFLENVKKYLSNLRISE